MPNPSSTIGRPDLGVLLEDFDLQMDQEGFIGAKVMPKYDVDIVSGDANKIKLESLLENRNDDRASDGTYAQADFQFAPWLFSCKEHGIEFAIDKRRLNIFKRYFDAEVVATQMAIDTIKRNKEKRVANALLSTSTFATAVTTSAGLTTVAGNTIAAGIAYNSANGAVKWTSPGTATPIFDIKLAIENIFTNSGLWADTVVMSRQVFMHLKQCQQLIDRIKYNGTKDVNLINEQDLANAFNVKNVWVAGGVKNTADKGQTPVSAQIWGSTQCFICKVAQRVSNPWDPGVGRIFNYVGDGGNENAVESYYDDKRRADVVRVRDDTDENVMYSAAGFLLTGCA